MKTDPIIEFLIQYGSVLCWLLFFTLILGGIWFTVHVIRPARSENKLSKWS